MKFYFLIILSIILLFTGCELLTHVSKSQEYSSESKIQDKPVNVWTWTDGSSTGGQEGIYEIQKSLSGFIMPGSRGYSLSWTDKEGNFYLFGGAGFDAYKNRGLLNDLWKFDGTSWTWISGSDKINQKGIYVNTDDQSLIICPGARYGSTCSTDKNSNVFIFGGEGYDADGNIGILNDLWKYDGVSWTWISGSGKINQINSSIPGARYYSNSWIDNEGNFYLFGGCGYDFDGKLSLLNDFWKFDGKKWTYITVTAVMPKERCESAGWTDQNGNLWLFGGFGQDLYGYDEYYNDLWKYNGIVWVKVSTDNYINQKGIYGDRGIPDKKNNPGSRSNCSSWKDPDGNFWLFGGFGYDISGWDSGYALSDLWKFDGNNWTWISGYQLAEQVGNYGIKGVPSASNMPGKKCGSAGWSNKSGNIWIFGGSGFDSAGNLSSMNDLWKYTP